MADAPPPERWQRIEALYHSALDLPHAARARFLCDVCGRDVRLREEVEALLAVTSAADGAFDRSVAPSSSVEAVGAVAASLVGREIGAYRVTALVGAGGMGQVYRARDPRLGRDVALKVLPAAFAADRERLHRFQQEARAAAALNHPNIVTIHSIEEADGLRFLTMEFVDGQPLSDLIRSGALSLERLLGVAIPLADALAAAHGKGITHRDLKPANIMVGADNRVKILDFGLAKLYEPSPGAGRMSVLPAEDVTGEGRIVGTAAYMSPEQAEGRPIDQRSDLFSLGVILYEMATGRRPFTGQTSVSILSSILKDTPPNITDLKAMLPRELGRIVRHALTKDLERRYQSAKDLRNDLAELQHAIESGELAVVSTREAPHVSLLSFLRTVAKGRWVGAVGSIALVGLLIGGLMWGRGKSTQHSDPSTWVPLTDFTDAATQPALSSDGRLLTFIRGPGSFITTGQIYVKVLPSGEPAALTHDAAVKMSPTFTPDGASITYTVTATWDTWIVPVVGGPSRLLVPNASGLTWIDPHHLLFSEIRSSRHMRVVTASSTRSEVRDVYVPPHEVDMAHRSYLSPDRSQVLVAEMQGESHWQPCRLVPFDGRSRGVPVGPPRLGCTAAAWSPEGRWMYFVAESTMGTHIWRQPFPDGTPEQLTSGPSEEDGIAMAPDGHSVVTSVGTTQTTVWIHTAAGDRQITSEGSALLPDRDGILASSVFSPDGRKLYYLAKPRVASGTTSQELWIADLDQGRSERALPDVHMTGYDISPDGQRVVYATPDATRGSRVWVAQLDRTVPPQPLGSSSAFESRPIYGPGGLLFFQATESGANFVYRMREDGSERVRVSPTSIIEFLGVSPDGQWVVAQVPVTGEKTPRGIVAYAVRDGSSRRVCYGYCLPSWSPDGRSFNVQWQQTGQTSQDDFRTLVIPLQVGQVLPPLPLAGLRSATDVAELKGATVVDGNIYMSRDRATYAWSRRTVHRNLYRIPVP